MRSAQRPRRTASTAPSTREGLHTRAAIFPLSHPWETRPPLLPWVPPQQQAVHSIISRPSSSETLNKPSSTLPLLLPTQGWLGARPTCCRRSSRSRHPTGRALPRRRAHRNFDRQWSFGSSRPDGAPVLRHPRTPLILGRSLTTAVALCRRSRRRSRWSPCRPGTGRGGRSLLPGHFGLPRRISAWVLYEVAGPAAAVDREEDRAAAS